jgi:hypothetical protein
VLLVSPRLIFLKVSASGWSSFLATLVLAVPIRFYSSLASDCLAAIRVSSLVFLRSCGAASAEQISRFLRALAIMLLLHGHCAPIFLSIFLLISSGAGFLV